MNLLGLVAALGCNTSLAIIDKTSGTLMKSRDTVLPFSFFKTTMCAVFALLLLPFGELKIDTWGILISLGAGIFHALSVVLIMHCLRNNPAVYVNLFMASGILLPSAFDWIFVYKQVKPLELLILALTVFSLSLVLNFKKAVSDRKQAGLGLLTVMFFCYGMLMVMQGAFPKLCEGGSKTLFSAIMYGSSAMMLGTICLFKKAHFDFGKKLTALGLTAAVLNLAINLLLTSLSAVLPSSAVFPAVHGLKLVAITLLSSVLWKEKLTPKQMIGSFMTIICVCIIGG